MPATSWKPCGTASSQTKSGSTISWADPTNVYVDDNAMATASLTNSDPSSHWLWCTNFGFTSSDVPAGATILGFEMRWSRKALIGIGLEGTMETYFQAIVGGSLVGTMKTNAADVIPSTEASESKGGASDLWGTTFSQANAVASDTGVAIARTNSNYDSEFLSVDIVEVRWHYSTGRRAISQAGVL